MTDKTHEKWIRPKLYLNCGAGISGGVMRVTSSSVEISYSTFINNSASNRGGVLELLYDSSLLILHSTFEDNMAIDACFYEGMNLYAKTWFQLAFPIYNFILVILIILISSESSRFSNFLGHRNPVATQATLIQLSYTKLLFVVITSFSPVFLRYPNGTTAVC